MTMETSVHEGCGGTILTTGYGIWAHLHCGRCRAYVHLDSDGAESFPTGTDRDANVHAFDRMHDRSPER